MGRGKHLSTKKREAKAIRKAELKAEDEFERSQKGLEKAFRQRLFNLIDRLDPIETVVFFSLTYIVFMTIEGMPDVLEKIRQVGRDIPWWVVAFSPIVGVWKGYAEVAGWIGEQEEQWKPPFVIHLCLSMAVAYLIMKHGWELITAIGGGIAGIAKALVGI